MELYGQLTPTKVYSAYETRTSALNDVICRLSGKYSKILTHVLAGCSSLVQTKYLERQNAALKVLFFEMRRQHKLRYFLGIQKVSLHIIIVILLTMFIIIKMLIMITMMIIIRENEIE